MSHAVTTSRPTAGKRSASPRRRTGALSTSGSKAVGPPLKWAGGKRWQLPMLHPLWASHARRRLVEPFCGGLAVSLGLRPKRALLNDVNPHLINFYLWLKRGFRTSLDMKNHEGEFYRNRTRFNALLTHGGELTAEAAALFYYLNKTGYNGLCRFNQKGEFNVPFGRYKKIGYRDDFTEYLAVFADWEFTNVDFEDVSLERDDFVYADPPYDVEFTTYAKDGFSWDDQTRAARWLAKHKGPVVLVNQATEPIKALYRGLGYTLTVHKGPRFISCTGDRSPAEEVFAVRNL